MEGIEEFVFVSQWFINYANNIEEGWSIENAEVWTVNQPFWRFQLYQFVYVFTGFRQLFYKKTKLFYTQYW